MIPLCGGNGAKKKAKKESKKLDKELLRYSKTMECQINILLLGGEGAGKSTVLKQMKVLHEGGFTDAEKQSYRLIIFSNVHSIVKTLAQEARSKGNKAKEAKSTDDETKAKSKSREEKNETEEAKNRVEEMRSASEETLSEAWVDVKKVWRDEDIQKIWREEGSSMNILDSAPYWYNNLDRISESNYMPTNEDIIWARDPPTTMRELNWTMSETRFKMTEVRAQTSHNRTSKMLSLFDGVTAVIFVVAMSDYNKKEGDVNKLQEALDLFESTVNSEWFFRTPFVIFFDRRNLFAEKIKKVDLSVYWPEYQDGCDLERAQEFIRRKFTSVVRDAPPIPGKKQPPPRGVYPHFASTVNDIDNTSTIFNAIKDILLRRQLYVFG